MPEVVAHEDGIGGAGEDASGGVPQAMQLHASQTRGAARKVVATAQGRGIQPATSSVADDVIVRTNELVPVPQAGEGPERWV